MIYIALFIFCVIVGYWSDYERERDEEYYKRERDKLWHRNSSDTDNTPSVKKDEGTLTPFEISVLKAIVYLVWIAAFITIIIAVYVWLF